MIKIKISTPWEASEFSTKRLLDQFKTSDSDVDGISFVYDDSYDVIFFFNYVNEEIRDGTRAYIFHHEPTFSGNHQRNFNSFSKQITIFAVDKDLYSPSEWVIETPAHTFYGGRGRWIDYEEDWNYTKAIEYNALIKTKNISSSVTNASYSESPNALYTQRVSLVKSLIPITPYVEYFGGWVSGYTNENHSPHKISCLKDFRFHMAIENEYIKNWVSEKFYDSIITNTIPIYYGCANIKDIYPEDGYVLLESITDIEYVRSVLYDINENAEEIYHQKLPNLLKIKQRYFEEYNLLKKIKTIALG
jgi:hypothetical protein